jgi:hemerythrin-like domain-containing protein
MLRDRALAPLSQQHHNALAVCVLTDRSLAGEPSPESLARLSTQLLDRYDNEVSNHFAVEEEDVFPVAEKELDLGTIVHELVAEHRQIEKIIDNLRTSPDREALRQFTVLLRQHIRREESDLFEELQAKLPRKTLDSMGAIIDARAVRIPI